MIGGPVILSVLRRHAEVRRIEVCSRQINQNKSGFTIIEVVIAVTIVGMLMTSIFAMLTASMRYTYISNSIVDRIFYVRNGFFDPKYQNEIKKDPAKKLTKKIEEPETELTFFATKPKNQILENRFKNSYQLNSEAKWKDLRETSEMIFGFKYIAPKKEQK